jgi:hypothetical protein
MRRRKTTKNERERARERERERERERGRERERERERKTEIKGLLSVAAMRAPSQPASHHATTATAEMGPLFRRLVVPLSQERIEKKRGREKGKEEKEKKTFQVA